MVFEMKEVGGENPEKTMDVSTPNYRHLSINFMVVS